jgi:hypothetical protein
MPVPLVVLQTTLCVLGDAATPSVRELATHVYVQSGSGQRCRRHTVDTRGYTPISMGVQGGIPTAPSDQQVVRNINHIGRLNNTLRQRVARLVRESWSCSKKLAD